MKNLTKKKLKQINEKNIRKQKRKSDNIKRKIGKYKKENPLTNTDSKQKIIINN